MYTCNLCKDAGEEFKVPAGDPVGVAIMQEHLREKHGISNGYHQS